ncbi:uncharacterized protein I303_108422 [Kwoniella dejecticola CBS 10117]|uniref:NAD(P)-binding protein n=1 Tax=Kwoniella dejecticola CBS 10117 TaxID=1296121 RepID=A0AAJ8KYB4_9TREE
MASQKYNISNLFGVQGKICVVTGGGTGLGRGIATALAVNGAKVFIIGRRLGVAEETAKEINVDAKESGMGGECVALEGDVGTKQGVVDVYEKVSKLTDRLDYLVNNAGYSANWRVYSSDLNDPVGLEKMLWSIEDVDFANMTAIHVAGPYLLAVKFIPLFKNSKDACVTNITSLASHFLNRAVCEYAYAQSKAAETHLTDLMAAGLTPFNIRVNSIAPGLFISQLTTGKSDKDASLAPVGQNQIQNIPKGRHGYWEEVAGAALMLASPAGSYMNAADIIIDGGWRLLSSAKDVQ